MKLLIAEKPSVAQSIAKVLGVTQKKSGYLEGSGYLISWCLGHLVELADAGTYDPRYKRWSFDDLPILPKRWQYVVQDGKDDYKKRQYHILASLMEDSRVDSIICATDAGREGELIFRLVYQQCGCQKPVERLWISSMEDSAIRAGMDSLKSGSAYDSLYQAALCRSKADWLVGINATRLFSALYNSTLNVGRVQSPTLAMLVRREQEIAAFKPTPFYTVELEGGGLRASSDRFTDKQTASGVLADCEGKPTTVQEVRSEEKPVNPSRLFDLTTLQREANRLLGFTAQQTLTLAQELYERKLLTYPRTDSRFLTEDMAPALPQLVQAAAPVFPFSQGKALTIEVSRLVSNAKVTDHHAILPTLAMANADLTALSQEHRQILSLVTARLLCAVGDKHLYRETAVTLNCAGHTYSAKGKIIVSPGWKGTEQAFLSFLKVDACESSGQASLPSLVQGQVLESLAAVLHEGQTTPPKHYTEDTLLSAMECAGDFSQVPDAERKGLGTPATRAGIIEKLVATGFVARQKSGKTTHLLPTQRGINLITILPDSVKSPQLTAEWEDKLKQIERGQLADTAFLDEITAFTRDLVSQYHNAACSTVDASLFGKQREAVGPCPRCGKQVVEISKGFVCEDKGCGFALWRDNYFFRTKKKELTKRLATQLLKNGRASVTGLFSEKKGTTYDATVVLKDTGGKYVNFELEFSDKK